jgi:hypothetical protein
MKIMFVGSSHWSERYRPPIDFPFETAGQELGYYAARRGHTILICSESKNTLDYWVMQGAKRFALEEARKKVSVVVYYPIKGRLPPYKSGDFELQNLHKAR